MVEGGQSGMVIFEMQQGNSSKAQMAIGLDHLRHLFVAPQIFILMSLESMIGGETTVGVDGSPEEAQQLQLISSLHTMAFLWPI